MNRHTDEQIDFFGIRLEAIRIDDSKPAVQFRLMAFPNGWAKTQVRKAATGSSIPALKAHRTRLTQRLETASEAEKLLIRDRIAEYDRRIAEAQEQLEFPTVSVPGAVLALEPQVAAPGAVVPEALKAPTS